jgi:hypothetical protein
MLARRSSKKARDGIESFIGRRAPQRAEYDGMVLHRFKAGFGVLESIE